MTTVGSCTGIRSDSGAIADAIVIITGIIGSAEAPATAPNSRMGERSTACACT